MKSIDLQFVKDTLLELDPSIGDESSETYHTALVLLSALTFGPNVTCLAAFTGLPVRFVAAIHQRMLQAQLWTDSGVCCDHWEVAEGVVSMSAFWADVLVAEGLVIRRWDADRADYCYFDSTCAGDHTSPVN